MRDIIIILCILTPTFLANATQRSSEIDKIAESYVHLVLSVGQVDSEYVDSYYGPAEWKKTASEGKPSLPELEKQGKELNQRLLSIKKQFSNGPESERMRFELLAKRLQALVFRVKMLEGEKPTFDVESKALYDIVAPKFDDEYFAKIISEIEKLVPGSGTTYDRVQAFRKKYSIPKEKLRAILTKAIEECRARTKKYINLPDEEKITLELVSDKPWNAYNQYKSNYQSTIQVNTDKPIHREKILDLVAHEGYPGHHVQGVLNEMNFLNKKHWVEYSIYALYGPESFMNEGTANFAQKVAFPGPERLKFMKEVIFPMAGFNPDEAEKYLETRDLISKLDYSFIEAARRYLDGKMTKEQTIDWLKKNYLDSEELAQGDVKFFDSYRSYALNYALGEKVITDYLDRLLGKERSTDKLWKAYTDILIMPRPASSF